jgi:hypothetical protein
VHPPMIGALPVPFFLLLIAVIILVLGMTRRKRK